MTISKKIWALSAILFFCLPVANANDISVAVVSTGHGATVEESKTDALKEAIQQTIGVYLVSTMEVKNDKLVKDDQIGFSAGMIKSFDIIDQHVDPNGGYITTVRATVDASKVESTFAATISGADVDGEALGQKLLIEQDKLRQKDRLFDLAFKDFYTNLFDVKVEKVGAQPTRVDVAPFDVQIKITINKAALNSLQSVLDVIAKDTSWLSSGKDLFVDYGWGHFSKTDFGDVDLSQKMYSLCTAQTWLQIDLLSKHGELITSKRFPFNKYKFVRCNAGPPGVPPNVQSPSAMLIEAGTTDELMAHFPVAIADIERVNEVKVFVTGAPGWDQRQVVPSGINTGARMPEIPRFQNGASPQMPAAPFLNSR
jgi:hypothetical protein